MYFSVFLIGIGLSMDAFAVAICKGLKMKKINYKQLGVIAVFFGVFQALMPLIGWSIAKLFGDNQYVKRFDHWIAFALLVFIGAKMAIESFGKDEEDCGCKFDIKEIFVMAIATSIDALAAGIALYLDDITALSEIMFSILIIGITTFVLSAFGVVIGHKFGAVLKSKAELVGGIILVLIGTKILLEGLEILKINLF